MTKLGVAAISAVLKPSTAASATAEFDRFFDSNAVGTPAAAACQGWTRHMPATT